MLCCSYTLYNLKVVFGDASAWRTMNTYMYMVVLVDRILCTKWNGSECGNRSWVNCLSVLSPIQWRMDAVRSGGPKMSRVVWLIQSTRAIIRSNRQINNIFMKCKVTSVVADTLLYTSILNVFGDVGVRLLVCLSVLLWMCMFNANIYGIHYVALFFLILFEMTKLDYFIIIETQTQRIKHILLTAFLADRK